MNGIGRIGTTLGKPAGNFSPRPTRSDRARARFAEPRLIAVAARLR